jgi:hypothetical protein
MHRSIDYFVIVPKTIDFTQIVLTTDKHGLVRFEKFRMRKVIVFQENNVFAAGFTHQPISFVSKCALAVIGINQKFVRKGNVLELTAKFSHDLGQGT